MAKGAGFLIAYVTDPYLQDKGNATLQEGLTGGGKWFALHSTSGGKAERLTENPRPKRMVKAAHELPYKKASKERIARYIDGFYNPIKRHSADQYTSPIKFEMMA